jgi:hypothetical protein
VDTRPGTAAARRGTVLRLVDAGTRLLRVLATSVALLGLLVAPPAQVLLVAPAVAVVAAVSSAALAWYLTDQWPRRRVPVTIALVAGGAVPFAHGLDLLGAAGERVALALLVLTASSVLGWIARADQAPVRAEPDPSWQDLVQVLPTGMLLSEWRSLDQRLRLEQDAPAGLTELRTMLLRELYRRDPAGVALSEHPEPADTRSEGPAPGDDGAPR